MKKKLLSLGLLAISFGAFAQTTQIVPAIGTYSQNFNSLDGTSTTYPSGFQGVKISSSVPSLAGRLNAAGTAVNLTANGTAATSSSGIYDFNGKIGVFSNTLNDYAIILSLNTTAVPSNKYVQIKFDAMVMRNLYDGVNNKYLQGLAFMYRIGNSGDYTLVNNDFITNETTTNTAGTNGVNIKSLTYTLPAACSNVAEIQLRWVMRTLSPSADAPVGADRPSFAIDNVSAEAVETLPVILSSFSVKKDNEFVRLNWTTSSEKNNQRFDILRAGDDKVFNKIAEVAGNNNSTTTIDYTFTDKTPLTGNNYYKLNQVDNDGKSEEFGPVLVNTGIKTQDFNVYASNDKAEVNFVVLSEITEKANINIYDIYGRTLAKQTVSLKNGSNLFTISVKNMNEGVYVAIIESASINVTKKFMK